jgi:arylsulfatase A-like enzyme
MKRTLECLSILVVLALSSVTAHAQSPKPNILVIMPDDVGYWNVSAYHNGMMGGRTPNIDSIAREGVLFTDAYAQQSCTAGGAAAETEYRDIRSQK